MQQEWHRQRIPPCCRSMVSSRRRRPIPCCGNGNSCQPVAPNRLTPPRDRVRVELSSVHAAATNPVCVNSHETTWLKKLGSMRNVDDEAALQSGRSPWTTHEFIAFWNSVAGMVRVWAGQITLPRATPFTDSSAQVALQRCPILCAGSGEYR